MSDEDREKLEAVIRVMRASHWAQKTIDFVAGLGDRIERLEADRPAPLAYSDDPPKVAGRYWHRTLRPDGTWVVDDEPWRLDESSLHIQWIDSIQFAGPIPEPLEQPS